MTSRQASRLWQGDLMPRRRLVLLDVYETAISTDFERVQVKGRDRVRPGGMSAGARDG